MSKLSTRAQIFEALALRDAAKAVVRFQGGNDEGGVDAIDLVGPAGNSVGELRECYSDPRDADEALAEALAAPVYDQYGGFNGDFSAFGTVTWDVAPGTVRMDKSETAWQEESLEV